MASIPEWKKLLQEPNAMGWIGLIVVAVLIGLGTLYYGGRDSAKVGPPVSHAAR
jgi:hypothetical protein